MGRTIDDLKCFDGQFGWEVARYREIPQDQYLKLLNALPEHGFGDGVEVYDGSNATLAWCPTVECAAVIVNALNAHYAEWRKKRDQQNVDENAYIESMQPDHKP